MRLLPGLTISLLASLLIISTALAQEGSNKTIAEDQNSIEKTDTAKDDQVNNPAKVEAPYQKDFFQGQQYFYNKKFSMAEKYLQKVLNQKPDHSASLSMMGDIYLLQKNYSLAKTHYKQAIEVSDNPALEHYRLGQVLMAEKNGNDAIESYNRAYQLDPTLKQSLFQLGYVHLVLERNKQETISNWQKFVDMAPQDAQAEKIKAILALLRQKDFKLPPKGSDISLTEALLLGGKTIQAATSKAKDKEAGHEKAKTTNKTEGLLDDAEL